MTKTIFDTWLARVEARQITYGQMRQFCEAIAGSGGRRTNLSTEQRDIILEAALVMFRDGGFDLIGDKNGVDWKAAGNDWLARNHRLALGTSWRGPSDHLLDEAAAGRLDFRWVGIEWSRYGGPLPIFRAIVRDTDETFDYYAVPWQRKAF